MSTGCAPMTLCECPEHSWNQGKDDAISVAVALKRKRRAAEDAPEKEFLAVAAEVAEARVAYAEAFLLRKARTAVSDGMAREQATIDTGSRLDIALARLEVARHRLTSAT